MSNLSVGPWLERFEVTVPYVAEYRVPVVVTDFTPADVYFFWLDADIILGTRERDRETFPRERINSNLTRLLRFKLRSADAWRIVQLQPLLFSSAYACTRPDYAPETFQERALFWSHSNSLSRCPQNCTLIARPQRRSLAHENKDSGHALEQKREG